MRNKVISTGNNQLKKFHKLVKKAGTSKKSYKSIYSNYGLELGLDIGYFIRIKDKTLLENLRVAKLIIKDIIGKNHYYTKQSHAHVTVINHLFDHDPANKQEVTPHVISAKHVFRKAARNLSPWRIEFSDILVTPVGIIGVGFDGGKMNDLRSSIINTGQDMGYYSHDKKLYPNINHTTIVIFKSPIDVATRKKLQETLRFTLLGHLNVDHILIKNFENFALWETGEIHHTFKLSET